MLQSRNQIARAWAQDLALPDFGQVAFETEVVLSPSLLGERRSTQVDAFVRGSDARALVECKFTESDGGACSQTVPRKHFDGSRVTQCNGRYELQLNALTSSTQHCALSAKGIRYWEYVPEVLRISPDIDHAPCPFVGGWYQWMRNMVGARALAQQDGLDHSFLIAYADGAFPMAKKIKTDDWQRFVEHTTGTVAVRTVSFQRLIALGQMAVTGSDGAVLNRLALWVEDKVKRAAP